MILYRPVGVTLVGIIGVIEAAHDGIVIVDPETRRIVDVNPFLLEFL